jgi:hypothetical protein
VAVPGPRCASAPDGSARERVGALRWGQAGVRRSGPGWRVVAMPKSRGRRKQAGRSRAARRPRHASGCPHCGPVKVPTVSVRPGPIGPPARPESGLCWRCNGRCRTDKPLYGWVCAVCADELDRYYVLACGLLGGDVVSRFLADVAAGRVLAPGPRPRPVNAGRHREDPISEPR